jgi:hypothetical protein
MTPRWTVAFFTAWALGLALWRTVSSALRDAPTLRTPRPAAN